MVWVVVLLIAVVLLAILLAVQLLKARGGQVPDGPPCEPPVVDATDVIPSVLDEKTLPGLLGVRLRGQPSTIAQGMDFSPRCWCFR